MFFSCARRPHIQKHGLAGLYAPARAQRRGGGRVNAGKAGGVNAGGQRVHGAGDAVAFQQARDLGRGGDEGVAPGGDVPREGAHGGAAPAAAGRKSSGCSPRIPCGRCAKAARRTPGDALASGKVLNSHCECTTSGPQAASARTAAAASGVRSPRAGVDRPGVDRTDRPDAVPPASRAAPRPASGTRTSCPWAKSCRRSASTEVTTPLTAGVYQSVVSKIFIAFTFPCGFVPAH